MTSVELRAVAWPVVGGISAVAATAGACGVAWRGGAPAPLPISFALLAAAAAFLLDEPASEVVDVTPTGPGRRTTVRALALLVPLGGRRRARAGVRVAPDPVAASLASPRRLVR